jgi:hypothetical protein
MTLPRTERRAVEREWVQGGVMLLVAGRIVGQPCSLRDLSAQGASVRLNGLLLLPIDFAVSFDGFRTIVDCRLIWRDGDFAGLTFRR